MTLQEKMLDLVIVEQSDKLLRQFEECTERIVHLRHQIAYLDGVRNDIREKIRALSKGEADVGKPGRPVLLNPVRSIGSEALRETAAVVRQLGGEVTAERLAKTLKMSPDAARLRLARTAKASLIIRTTLGHYRALVSRDVTAGTLEDEDIPLEVLAEK